MFAPSEQLASLDWREIRRQYEEDGASVRSLAINHGIASRTTIRRKIAAEGWKAPGQKEPEPVLAQYAPPEQSVPPPADDEPDVEIIPMARLVADRALHDTAAQIQADKMGGEVLGANHLAALHTERIKEQLDISKRVTGAGLRVFAMITQLLEDDTDPLSMERAGIALRRLTNVNPDKDTLAGLLKAAADVVAKGLDIERRALGMDVQRKPGGSVDRVPELSSPKRPAGALIKLLDPETAFRLREAAQRTIQERRASEIAAQSEED